ncbi:MAG: hypothetical protein RMJ33_02510 [Saprospiraceae bacterium]|nr:hypothetical protein [Saprospiraceae bacterium]MDW8228688.1 hypothetical protein [Saprospiraceae bacterium]
MSLSTFLAYLTFVTVVAAAAVGGLMWLLPAARTHLYFAVGVVVAFIALCFGLFLTGRRAAVSTSKHLFTQLVMGSVFGKMLGALAFLLIYREEAKPENAWYVGIFLILYALYTVFEVWFMTRLAKS